MLYLGFGAVSDRNLDASGAGTSPTDTLQAYQEQQLLEEQDVDQLGDCDVDGDAPLPPLNILDSSDEEGNTSQPASQPTPSFAKHNFKCGTSPYNFC